ncbi:jg17652 [Pararge aegeria aegeria]|uniref:Jg17652 protein n=1 Tax=Pararge aegeria aegeria TaxID=348720 RepID=A0A8S4RGH1_9NEOP|nr:jg17652 [Pararge aegeria aegeria]
MIDLISFPVISSMLISIFYERKISYICPELQLGEALEPYVDSKDISTVIKLKDQVYGPPDDMIMENYSNTSQDMQETGTRPIKCRP